MRAIMIITAALLMSGTAGAQSIHNSGSAVDMPAAQSGLPENWRSRLPEYFYMDANGMRPGGPMFPDKDDNRKRVRTFTVYESETSEWVPPPYRKAR